jgi:carbon monoxide dehydrogenase subunit G
VLQSRTLSVSIERPPADVYDFVSNPENLPKWAPGLCRSVRRSEGQWIVETPDGPVKFRFVERNELGVLDHSVSPAPGLEIMNPMRVVPNGSGSEVIFTVFQRPGMSAEQFTEDTGLVERDLRTLKTILER